MGRVFVIGEANTVGQREFAENHGCRAELDREDSTVSVLRHDLSTYRLAYSGSTS
ncbi:hypothetical protein GCM10009619_25940 [Williamsia maris]